MTVRQIGFLPANNIGYIWLSGAVWASVKGATSGWLISLKPPAGGTRSTGSGTGFTGVTYAIPRLFWDFNTDVMPAGASLVLANLGLALGYHYGGDSSFEFYIVNSSHSSPIVAGDFDTYGGTLYSAKFNSSPANSISTVPLNAAALAYIAANIGVIVKFAAIHEYDHENDAPTLYASTSHTATDLTPSGRATVSPATNITRSSATLNGVAEYSQKFPLLVVRYTGGVELGTIYPRFRFKWWVTASGEGSAQFTSWQTDELPGDAFADSLTGLTPDTQYSYRVQADEDNGTYETGIAGFTTLVISTPTVTTGAATAVGSGVGTLKGTLEDDGGEACDCGFEWGETVSPYENTTPTQSRETGQTFSQALAGLDPDTTYHFRAFATNAAGTSYGDDATFTTDPPNPSITAPEVSTDEASEVGQELANINGTLDNDGGEACDCNLEWGRTTSYGTTTQIGVRTTGEAFSQEISSLTPNTEYHFRAFATNSAGTSYGDDVMFTTKQRPLVNYRPIVNRSYALSRHEV